MRGEGTFLAHQGHFHMYVNLFSGVALMTKYCHKKTFGLYEITWFPWLPIMQFWRNGVFRDSHEQFGTHEKLSPTSTIHVNCMKHVPIDLIYNFMLSKAFLIHIYMYIVSIWYMTSFTIHLALNKCLYAYNFRLIFAGNLIYRQDVDSASSAPIQHDTGKNTLFKFPKLHASKATCSPIG